MLDILNRINSVLWGPATLVLFMGTGVFLMCRLQWLPLRKIFYAMKLLVHSGKKDTQGDISGFQSLMTSLAACIGTGNIAGVASAMVLGGPGALVWMNISALLGLSTIFSETLLTMLYRRKNKNKEMSGGPMYVMADGIGGCAGKVMAAAFSVFAVGASFGIGNMTQSNTAAAALFSAWRFPKALTGAAMALLTMAVIVGGIKSIGKFCGFFIPAAAVIYTGCAAAVIIANKDNVMPGICQMLKMAFSPTAFAGGLGGTVTISLFQTVKWGVARGVFSNESGLGSAPIAAAAARCENPVHQAYIQMTGPIFDTVIMCTVTGLAIAASGVLETFSESSLMYDGAALTTAAFSTVLGKAAPSIIAAAMAGFALPTIIGWAYYGEKALEYITDKKAAIWVYKIVYSGAVFFGAVKPMAVIWAFSDMMNGLMAIPNLMTVLFFSTKVKKVVQKNQILQKD